MSQLQRRRRRGRRRRLRSGGRRFGRRSLGAATHRGGRARLGCQLTLPFLFDFRRSRLKGPVLRAALRRHRSKRARGRYTSACVLLSAAAAASACAYLGFILPALCTDESHCRAVVSCGRDAGGPASLARPPPWRRRAVGAGRAALARAAAERPADCRRWPHLLESPCVVAWLRRARRPRCHGS